jgi:subtilisin family serine protease
MKKIALLIFLSFVTSFFAQNDSYVNWYNSSVPGLSTEKAYKFLKKMQKNSQEVIVAVIDSGVDIEHEDLQGKIWVNTKEIPGNKIDDDANGYIDDIYGWNFLGNSKGDNVEFARYEKVRIFADLRDKYERLEKSQVADNEAYSFYIELKKEINESIAEYENYRDQSKQLIQILKFIPTYVATKIGKTDFNLTDLKNWKAEGEDERQIKNIAIAVLLGEISEEILAEQLKQIEDELNYHLNPDYDDRKIIGDKPHDFNDINYGNNDVEGSDALHGTHVAGIIAALRGNNLGGDGIAENVKIMSLRAVPNGDEHDKDIALAIRYAVDNGAKIINMSFGKAYSSYQMEVYQAMIYADSLDVLLVHAAGNDHKNIDIESNFPAVNYVFQKKSIDLLFTIGASTYTKGMLAADFSNYGKKSVDIFAPGKDIYNTIPNNKYKKLDGTSMATPMVSGVAAVLKSYYPKLTMKQIKSIIIQSGRDFSNSSQKKPGEDSKVEFSNLSSSGKIVNLLNAVKMCENQFLK